ncbi:MAG: gamma-glutamyltransferase [Rhodospirillaceae bacterium]|nr:gamma-glutamyltransferase [Rhodospirillaceae bacterium]
MHTLFTHSFKTAIRREVKATLPRTRGQTALAWLSAILLSGGLSACSPEKPAQGVIGYVAGFAGFVSAEEPRAALIGEDILSAGGTAADAATAMAAALTVTMPSRAGWMGGGVCLSRLPKDKSVQVISFLPEPLPGGGFAPGMPRGLYALHAASGTMRWETILAPAENLARFGVPVSRAFAKDLETLGGPVALGDGVRDIFTRKDGALLREGDNLVQLRAATVMTSLRMKGAGEAYAGKMAQVIAAAMPEREDDRRTALRAYRAQVLAPVVAEVEHEAAYFPPAPFAGPRAAKMWSAVGTAETPQSARIGLASPPMSTYGATGFVVVDRGGMTVSCTLSMGQMFGSGQVVGSTGVLGYSPLDGDRDVDAMLPMLIGNKHLKDLRVAVAGTGASAVSDALDFAARVRFAGQTSQDAVSAVAAAGDAGSRVTGVFCPEGAPSRVDTCTMPVDPRGAGVSRAVGIEFGNANKKIRF